MVVWDFVSRDFVIFVGVLVGLVGVTNIFVGVKRSGEQGVRRGVLLAGRYMKDFGCGVIIFVQMIVMIFIQTEIERCWSVGVGSLRLGDNVGEVVVIVGMGSVVREGAVRWVLVDGEGVIFIGRGFFGKPRLFIMEDTSFEYRSDLIGCVVGEGSIGGNGNG